MPKTTSSPSPRAAAFQFYPEPAAAAPGAVLNARLNAPEPFNEPILTYGPGTPEKKALKAKLQELKTREIEVPLFIGGKEVRTGKLGECRPPHDQSRLLGKYHKGGAKEAGDAVAAALKARKEWAATPFHARAAVFLKAAELLAGPYRASLNAATMLCQSKNVYQAEIDAACELADFWRFNVHYAEMIYAQQPLSPKGQWNMLDYRPLEGFIFAVTPFNFTSIIGNLPTAPALMGNAVVWKPASNTAYTAHFILEILRQAGLPDGVVNLVLGPASEIGNTVIAHRDLAGIHFTGSTGVFHDMWETVGKNIRNYKGYPRLVGETGGKDFIIAHPSAEPDAVATAMVRGAFEYQGQKCSAASRAYIPRSLWPKIKEKVGAQLAQVKMGDPEDFTNFVNAVIDRASFENIESYIQHARKSTDGKVIFGGKADDSKGFFVEPTVIETTNPHFKSMEEEIFGPVLTVFVYPDGDFDKALELCDRTSPYALTGAVFSQDRSAILKASQVLVNAAGNFYINDKPTGAVVGQQPFGGARASGTNDKAGSYLNLVRWVSPRTIKENFAPPTDFKYPFMAEK